jgi:pimeloyl-ACP methyl ester carboxylesterase
MITTETAAGAIVRSGVRIAYETEGHNGRSGPTILLLPAWAITNRRLWAAQVQRLSRDHRVITYDGRGSGDSDRPVDPAAHDVAELVTDALAVLDATGTDRAVLVGNSLGGLVAYVLAAQQPQRVAGLVLLGASVDLAGDEPSDLQRAMASFDEVKDGDGWARYNRHAWARDFPGFVRWFIDTALGDEATDEARAEGVAAGLDVDPAGLAATLGARTAVPLPVQAAQLRTLADRISAPAVVIHGDRDRIVPPAWGAAQAWLLGAVHHSLAGAGHCPQVTRPDAVAELITAFTQEVAS